MATYSYPPYIQGVIFDADGRPAAGGTVEAYVAGSSVPAPLFSISDPPTSLGSVVAIDSAGVAAFRLREDIAYKLRAKDRNGALLWERDNVHASGQGSGGMENPMTSIGDMIVGGAAGAARRLSTDGAAEGYVLKLIPDRFGDLVQSWEHEEGMQNPMTEQGDLIAGAADGAPMRLAHPGGFGFLRAAVVSGIGKVLQWVGLIAGQHITITHDGAGTTISADDQDGDHKVATSASDSNPDYLVEKLLAGQNVHIAEETDEHGYKTLRVSADTQNGDRKVKVSASDSEPNYLRNKVLGGDLIYVEREQTLDGDGGYVEDLRVHLDARGVPAGYVPIADGSNGAAWGAQAGGGMTNPMDGFGQMITGGVSGAPMKLSAATSGTQFLGVTTTPYGLSPTWWAANYPVIMGLAASAAGFTKGDLLFGGDPLAAAGILTGYTSLQRLAIGTEGQALFAGSSGLPEWKNLPATMQENFALLDSTSNYATTNKSNRIYAAKVVANTTAKRSKLGFFHKQGTLGKVILGVYEGVPNGAIIAQTAAFSPTAATEDKVCWEDALAEFQMTAGEEYWFVAYFTEDGWQLNIDALGMEKSSAFDVNFIGSAAANALTELPATLPTLTFETLAFYVAAK